MSIIYTYHICWLLHCCSYCIVSIPLYSTSHRMSLSEAILCRN